MKIKTNVKAEGGGDAIDANHNQMVTRCLKVKSHLRAGR
jgi:hypothetical protein